MLLVTAIGLSLLGSFGGLIVASSLLLIHDRVRTQFVPWLVSYAVGALLGVALLALLPEALETLQPARMFGVLLAGILTFFVLEKLVLWRHSHTHDYEVHGATTSLILLGDAFHNFIDGAVIATAVLSSIPLGLNTAVAVAAHEIPQEVGDFAILLAGGYSRSRALSLNALSAAAGVLGAILAYSMVEQLPAIQPYLLTFAAASFLYVAMSDLIPGLHRGRIEGKAFRQIILVVLGVATVLVF